MFSGSNDISLPTFQQLWTFKSNAIIGTPDLLRVSNKRLRERPPTNHMGAPGHRPYGSLLLPYGFANHHSTTATPTQGPRAHEVPGYPLSGGCRGEQVTGQSQTPPADPGLPLEDRNRPPQPLHPPRSDGQVWHPATGSSTDKECSR